MNDTTHQALTQTTQPPSHVRDGILGVLTIMGICLVGAIIFIMIGVGAGRLLGVL